MQKRQEKTGVVLVCKEGPEETMRLYWPAHSAHTQYLAIAIEDLTQDDEPGIPPETAQGGGSDAAPSLRRSGQGGGGDAAPSLPVSGAYSHDEKHKDKVSSNLPYGVLGNKVSTAKEISTSKEISTEKVQGLAEKYGTGSMLKSRPGLTPRMTPHPKVARVVPRKAAESQLALPDRQGSGGDATVSLPTPVRFFSGDDMLPTFQRVFGEIKKSFAGLVYQMDHTELCAKLVILLGKGVVGRLLCDRSNFTNSSCARQNARVLELAEAGCQFRTLKPKGAGFACQHAKAWISDGQVVLTGSVNMTHNGLENNKEHLVEIRDNGVVADIHADFELTWDVADEVTPGLWKLVKEGDAKKKEKTLRQTKSASSLGRTTSRSLSSELEDVVEEPKQ